MLALFHPMALGPISQSLPGIFCLGYLMKLWSAGELYGWQHGIRRMVHDRAGTPVGES